MAAKVILDSKQVTWFRKKLWSWAKENLRDYPWRSTDSPYEILVAEFLLQQTNADTVVPVYEAFLSCYPTLENLAAANLDDIASILQPLGLFFRSQRLLETAKIVSEKHKGKIPKQESQLLKLPGVGIYTAKAVASQAFQAPVAVMDTNVARILERFFGIQGERVKSRCKILWGAADLIAPSRKVGRWNLTLLDFGALVCTARNPKCHDCPLAKRCLYSRFN